MGGWTLLETGNQKLRYLGLKRTDRKFPKERIGARDSDLVRGYRGSHHPTPPENMCRSMLHFRKSRLQRDLVSECWCDKQAGS